MLNETLKRLRKEKGLSQQELAEQIHVVRQTVSKWEKGLSFPDSEMLVALAVALDTTVAALVGETPEEATTSDAGDESAQVADTPASSKRKKRVVMTSVIAASAVIVLSTVLLLCMPWDCFQPNRLWKKRWRWFSRRSAFWKASRAPEAPFLCMQALAPT